MEHNIETPYLLDVLANRLNNVPMNDVRFQSFHGPVTAIGTQNLRSCSVVLVASRSGAILAHIMPLFSDLATTIVDRFERLYEIHKEEHFSSTNETWVVSGVVEGDGGHLTVLDNHDGLVENRLSGMGLLDRKQTWYQFRIQPTGSSPNFAGKGTVLVDGSGPEPVVYVEDKPVN